MKTRRNQPENTPRGRFRVTPGERPATTFIGGRHAIRFTTALPPGVLARLLARKNRHARLQTTGLKTQRPRQASMNDEFCNLSAGHSSRYKVVITGVWRP